LAADEAPRVVVVSSDTDSTRFRRLTAELRSLGLVVVSVRAEANVAPEKALPEVARRERAMAAVQVVRLPLKEQVWIADRVTNKTLVRELPRSALRPDQTDDSIAVGVAELLRASLMEVNSESHARGDYAPTDRVRELAYSPAPSATSAASSRVWVVGLAGIQPGLRGAGSAGIFQGGAGWRAGTGFGVETLACASVSPISVVGSAGAAQLSSQWLGVGPSLEWPSRATPLHAEIGIALAASRVVARGQRVLAPFVSAEETAYSPAIYFHGGPAFGQGRFQLRLDVGVLLLASPANIHLADQRAAVWGAPALHVTLGIASRVWP